MKVITIKSAAILDEELQNEVHHTFGMEHYTDYVFTPRKASEYSATIVLEDSGHVIRNVTARCIDFPGHEFVIDDLDMEKNSVTRYRMRDGQVVETMHRGWDWPS
jgi:hypothetical protein